MQSFILASFNKRDSFPFSIVRMPDKSSNALSSIVYSANGAESLRTARVSNNPESFSTAIKLLIACMSRQWLSIGKVNKHQVDFYNACQSKQ